MLVLAQDLVEACLKRYELDGQRRRDRARARRSSASASAIRSTTARSPVYLGDYVTLETAPASSTRRRPTASTTSTPAARYGMKDDEILNPVQGDGRYAGSLPLFGGLKIWKANPQIVDKLREAGALLHAEKFTHSYMHCWRHKTPIIYRATTQWFAGMDEVPGCRGAQARARRCARPRCAASTPRSSIRRGARRGCTA